MKDLSVIIVSYNTEEMTQNAIFAIQKSFQASLQLQYEIIVVDNGSSDNSVFMLKKLRPISKQGSIHLIFNNENTGFGAANNKGINHASGAYILLLNSDVIADNVNFEDLIQYMNSHEKVGILTVRVELQNGSVDPASHRGFPTLWRSLCYFSKLQAITKSIPILNRLFGGYHLTYKNINTEHEIDSPTAAFLFTKRSILEKVSGFDETFFFYGEDLDLAFRIKELGYSAIYYPKYTVLHLKHQSGLKSSKKSAQSNIKFHFFNAMKIFYDKHYAPHYPHFVNLLVHKAIEFKYRIS